MIWWDGGVDGNTGLWDCPVFLVVLKPLPEEGVAHNVDQLFDLLLSVTPQSFTVGSHKLGLLGCVTEALS